MTKQAFGQRTFEKKMVGIVNYKTGKNRVKFTLVEEGKTFNGGLKSITLNMEDLPARPRLKPESEGKIRVRMSSDGSEVEALTPVSGIFNLELVSLGKRDGEDADPMPYPVVWNEGTERENRYLEFFAVYEISEGMYKGVVIPAYKMHYKFEEDLPAHPDYTRFAGNFDNKKATRLFQLRDWGDVHGVWTVEGGSVTGEPIAWDDETILPEIQERALEQPYARGVIKDGYLKEVLPLEDDDVAPFGEDEDLDAVDDDLDDATKIEVEPEPVKTKKVSAKDIKKNGKAPVKKLSKKSKSDEDDEEL